MKKQHNPPHPGGIKETYLDLLNITLRKAAEIADYEFVEFTPSKFHPDLAHLLTA